MRIILFSLFLIIFASCSKDDLSKASLTYSILETSQIDLETPLNFTHIGKVAQENFQVDVNGYKSNGQIISYGGQKFKGTAPRVGIQFEHNDGTQFLVNIHVFSNKSGNLDKQTFSPVRLIENIHNVGDAIPANFNGAISITDLSKENQTTLLGHFVDGLPTKSPSTFPTVQTRKSTRKGAIQKIGECVDYYLVTYANGSAIEETYMFSVCGGGGGGNGPGGGGAPDPTNQGPPECSSWNYVPTSNPNVMACGVSNVESHYFSADMTRDGLQVKIIDYVFVDDLFFEFPSNYSPGNAAETTAQAIDDVDERMQYEFRLNPPSGNEYQTTFLLYLNEELSEFGARATFDNYYQTSSITPFDWNVIGIGDCN